MSGAFLIAIKDLKLLLRDRVALFWVFGFPLVFAVFFGSVMKAAQEREQNPPALSVVDEERSPASRRLVGALAGEERLSVVETDRASAESAVRRGDRLAYLRIQKGFGAGEASPVLGFDPGKPAEARMLSATLEQLIFAGPRSGEKAGARLETRAELSQLRRPPSGFDVVFPAAVLWGLMGCAASFAVAMVSERTRGTLLRLEIAPCGKSAILVGKAFACFIACLAIALLLTLLGVALLGVRPENYLFFAIAVSCTAFCFVGITMLLSVVGRSEQAVAGAGWASLILFAMIGGAMVPLSAMPEWLRAASDLSPVKWGILSIEGAIWRGFSFAELQACCGILLGMGTLSFALGLELMSRAEAR